MAGLILIVDDEKDLADSLAYNLNREGYQTRVALTGGAGLTMAARDPVPDLVLLDLMLPDMSGTDVCRELRRADRTKEMLVLMLTARAEEIDRVVGFEVGCDDYVTKPFSVRELILRIKALLRRGRAEDAAPSQEMTFGVLRVDPEGHRVWVGESAVTLTALEFRLLVTFMERRGRVQTRDVLLSDVWGIEADVTTRTVDTHVKRLREKLGPAGVYVETLRSVGYRFRSRPDEEQT